MAISLTKRRVRAACLFLAAAIVCASAQKRISVPKDFPTIQAALGEAVEGDTVYVRNGVYYENVVMVDDVVLVGQDKKSTIIDGRRRGPAVTGADGAVLTGFTIRNGRTGVLCKNTRPIITNNIVIDNKGTGIHALVTLPDVTNNVIYRNEWTGIFLESVRGTRTSIAHNVIMENGYSGIFCANYTEVLIRNNIIYGNKQYGVFAGPNAVKSRLVGNDIYANRLPFNNNLDNETTRQQNISVDPQFVGAGFPRHNYSVKSNSPCKGKGEEGADIGLSDDVIAVAPLPEKEKASSELDQYFGSSSTPSGGSSYSEPSYSAPPQASSAGAPPPITGPILLQGVNFWEGSDQFTPESYSALDQIYTSLAYYSDLRVEIAGHTDNVGDEDANKSLSMKRARAVLNYLVSKGIPKSRMTARGYGMERPVASNGTEDGRAANRRIEVIPVR
jgi:outer membrane protein OmpA-like peptidoglycan-associated protein